MYIGLIYINSLCCEGEYRQLHPLDCCLVSARGNSNILYDYTKLSVVIFNQNAKFHCLHVELKDNIKHEISQCNIVP